MGSEAYPAHSGLTPFHDAAITAAPDSHRAGLTTRPVSRLSRLTGNGCPIAMSERRLNRFEGRMSSPCDFPIRGLATASGEEAMMIARFRNLAGGRLRGVRSAQRRSSRALGRFLAIARGEGVSVACVRAWVKGRARFRYWLNVRRLSSRGSLPSAARRPHFMERQETRSYAGMIQFDFDRPPRGRRVDLEQ
jgi:hypothetical protein